MTRDVAVFVHHGPRRVSWVHCDLPSFMPFVKHTATKFSVVVIEKHWRGVTKRSVCDEFWSKVLESDNLQVSSAIFYFLFFQLCIPPMQTRRPCRQSWLLIVMSEYASICHVGHLLAQLANTIQNKIYSISPQLVLPFLLSRKFRCSRYVFVSVYRGNLFFLGIVENEVRACWL